MATNPTRKITEPNARERGVVIATRPYELIVGMEVNGRVFHAGEVVDLIEDEASDMLALGRVKPANKDGKYNRRDMRAKDD